MGVLDWLDPTRSWPVVPGPAPSLNRISLQFEGLRFGAPIDAARVLGRPDTFHWTNRLRKDCELHYASKGLRLRFKEARLAEVTFLIGAARPTAPDGTPLTPQTTRDQIAALFGTPDPGGSDEETAQIFHGNGVASDFNFAPQDRLIEWSLYPDD